MAQSFEWHASKAHTNLLRKHGVSFEEAMGAFRDPLSVTIPDPDHSYDEERLILLGLSDRGRLLVVVHVDSGDPIRIVSARLANRYERRQYEQG